MGPRGVAILGTAGALERRGEENGKERSSVETSEEREQEGSEGGGEGKSGEKRERRAGSSEEWIEWRMEREKKRRGDTREEGRGVESGQVERSEAESGGAERKKRGAEWSGVDPGVGS